MTFRLSLPKSVKFAENVQIKWQEQNYVLFTLCTGIYAVTVPDKMRESWQHLVTMVTVERSYSARKFVFTKLSMKRIIILNEKEKAKVETTDHSNQDTWCHEISTLWNTWIMNTHVKKINLHLWTWLPLSPELQEGGKRSILEVASSDQKYVGVKGHMLLLDDLCLDLIVSLVEDRRLLCFGREFYSNLALNVLYDLKRGKKVEKKKFFLHTCMQLVSKNDKNKRPIIQEVLFVFENTKTIWVCKLRIVENAKIRHCTNFEVHHFNFSQFFHTVVIWIFK